MTDLTPIFVEIIADKSKSAGHGPDVTAEKATSGSTGIPPTTEKADEFLKEAHRIVSLLI